MTLQQTDNMKTFVAYDRFLPANFFQVTYEVVSNFYLAYTRFSWIPTSPESSQD